MGKAVKVLALIAGQFLQMIGGLALLQEVADKPVAACAVAIAIFAVMYVDRMVTAK